MAYICLTTLNRFFYTITALLEVLTAQSQCAISGLSPSYCVNSPSSSISASPPGGVLSGTGVTAGAFSPSLAGVGIHTVTYAYCSTAYSIEPAAFAPPAYSPSFVVLGDNQVTSALPIGFDFRFFCKTYNQFYISSNGFITFTPPQSDGCCQGLALPTGTVQKEMIASAWTDLDPSQGGTIRYAQLGTAPTRSLLISFNCIFHKTGQGPVTSEILLCESSNVIEILTTTKPIPVTTNSYNTTMGIQDGNGLALVVPGRNGTATWTATSETMRFLPGAFCDYTATTTVLSLPTVLAVASRTAICYGESTALAGYGASGYYWSSGSTLQAMAVSPSVSTVYTFTGSSGNGCAATSSVEVKVLTCTGVEEGHTSANLSVYPVPSKGEVTVTSDRPLSLVLYNELGQAVHRLLLNPENGFSARLRALAPGLYWLRPDGKGSTGRKLIILPGN
jgi:hypothetical protein